MELHQLCEIITSLSPMTPAQAEEQRRSFVAGNVGLSNPNVTRELVDEVAQGHVENTGHSRDSETGIQAVAVKRIYLAGPMSGIEDYNFPAFFSYAAALESRGNVVFNPAQNDLDNWGDIDRVKKHATYRECLSQDLAWICAEADAIALMPGWEQSKGARVEHALATAIGIEFIYLGGI